MSTPPDILRIFTFLPGEAIDQILEEHNGNEHQRMLQKKLAEEVTTFVHGKENYQKAIRATELLFSRDTLQVIASLTAEDLDATLTGVPAVEVSKEQISASNPDVVTFLAETGILPSKGEARKMLQGGGISFNKQKVTDVATRVGLSTFINEKYLFVQKGKTNYYLVKVV